MEKIFNKNFENELKIFNKNDIEIVDDKIARDFLRLLLNDPKIKKENFDFLLDVIKFSAMINDRNFVTQSDLFILFQLNEKPFENFDLILRDLLQETMFKTDIYYKNMNSNFKDEITEMFNNGSVPDDVKKYCNELSEWLIKRIEFLENSSKEILNGEQLKNKLNQDLIKSFYDNFVEELLKVYKWQQFCFNMVTKKG